MTRFPCALLAATILIAACTPTTVDAPSLLPRANEKLSFDEPVAAPPAAVAPRSEEHTSELQSLMRISYAVFCLKKKTITITVLQLIAYHKTTNRTLSYRITSCLSTYRYHTH